VSIVRHSSTCPLEVLNSFSMQLLSLNIAVDVDCEVAMILEDLELEP
jgi:hypothetical protein